MKCKSPLAKQWFEIERVLAPAVRREQHTDSRPSVDWGHIDRHVRLGALAIGCAMLEDAGRKGVDEHVDVLFEIRNALIHNAGDLAKNRNSRAVDMARTYLREARHSSLSTNIPAAFFSLTGTVVTLQANVFLALRICML